MKLVSFESHGERHVGIVEGSDLLVITDASWTGGKTLRAMIERDELGAAQAHAGDRIALASVQLLPPVFDPPRIWCVGVNYHEHRIETGRDPTEQPTIFTRTPQSQVGHGWSIEHARRRVRAGGHCHAFRRPSTCYTVAA